MDPIVAKFNALAKDLQNVTTYDQVIEICRVSYEKFSDINKP